MHTRHNTNDMNMNMDQVLKDLVRADRMQRRAAARWEDAIARRRAALLACERAGCTHQQIATALGVSRSRAGRLLQDARRHANGNSTEIHH